MGASHCSSASWLLGSEASVAGGFWRRSLSVLTGKALCRPTSAGPGGHVWGEGVPTQPWWPEGPECHGQTLDSCVPVHTVKPPPIL